MPADGRALFRRDDETDVIQFLAESPLLTDMSEGFSSLYVFQEIHLDRLKHDPLEVRLFNISGDPIVVSRLEDYKEIDGQRIPMKLTFRFLRTHPTRAETTVTLKLKRVSLTKEINPALFAYHAPPVERHEDLDSEEPGDEDESTDDSAE